MTTVPDSTPGTVTDAEGGEAVLDGPSASTLPLLGAGQFPDWMDRGVCHQTDPELFFPEKGGSTREAMSICARCPVAAECLDYAIDNDERFGIWGGVSERHRRAIKKAMEEEAGVERVPCPRCDETFRDAVALAAHARHTHDRPDETFACPACEHTSTVKQGLTLHIRAAHPELRNAS